MKIARSLFDLCLVSVLIGVYAILARHFDIYEAVNQWLQQHERWELDEIFMTSWVLALLLIWYAWRRRQEAMDETHRRIRVEQDLRQIQTDLAERVAQRTQEWQVANQALHEEINVREQVEQELRQAHQNLQQTHELYRRAIMAIDGVPYEREYTMDELVFRGEGIRDITGYTQEEMSTQLWEELAIETVMRGETEGLGVEEAIRRTRLGEFNRWRCDTLLRTRNGQSRWVADASVEIHNEQGKPVGSIGILVDITEQKQAAVELQETNRRLAETLEQLQQTQQHLIQQERLSAMGTMASGIAHDFNNLLAPILGFTELLLLRLDRPRNPEKERHYLQTIYTAAQNATTVVSRLREFYRYRDAQEPQQPVDLQVVVEDAILLTQPHWKEQALAEGIRVQIETDLQPVPLIVGNKAELQEMLTNLILNAVHALREEGVITIHTYTECYPLGIHEIAQPLPTAVLAIRDTGIGMDEETQRRCFEPFFSTKGDHGTGLGLAAVYGTVQRHGGAITVASAPEEGTTFSIYLPVPVQLPMADTAVPSFTTPPLQVLVIDDNTPVRDVIVESLYHAQHQVEIATNGREGLEKFCVGHFDLVITDRAMPILNGDSLASAIKELRPTTPVILLTGFGELMQANGELPKGVDCVMRKPFTFSALQQTIAQVMEIASRTN